MSVIVRTSKFRHVYAEAAKPEAQYGNLRLWNGSSEGSYIKANSSFFACGLQGGGGPFAVIPLSQPKRYDADVPTVTGHTAPVLDFDFNPFDDCILASASEDQTVKIWRIPAEGFAGNMNEPVGNLRSHDKKVILLRFHPTASNVLASVSADQTVKVWDIEKQAQISTMGVENCQDIVWDYFGANYATSSKDKHVRLIDPRTTGVTTTIQTAHEGSKSIKLTFAGSLDRLVTVGFTKFSARQFKIWDPRNTSLELKKVEIDQSAGTIMPFFDADTNILYLAGKGDGNVRYYELVDGTPFVHPLSEYKSNVSARGMAWVPKRALNVMGCETARLLKLTPNSVEPLCFFVPRRSDNFQEDLYPPTASAVPAQTSRQWVSGSDKPPNLMSVRPAGVGSGSGSERSSGSGSGSGGSGGAASESASTVNESSVVAWLSGGAASPLTTNNTEKPAPSSSSSLGTGLGWLVGGLDGDSNDHGSSALRPATSTSKPSSKDRKPAQVPAPVTEALRNGMSRGISGSGANVNGANSSGGGWSSGAANGSKVDIKSPPLMYSKPSLTLAQAKKSSSSHRVVDEHGELDSANGRSNGSGSGKRTLPADATSPYDNTPSKGDDTGFSNLVCGVEKVACIQS